MKNSGCNAACELKGSDGLCDLFLPVNMNQCRAELTSPDPGYGFLAYNNV